MEVQICVEPGTNMSVVEQEYPDISPDDDGRYFVGCSSDDTPMAGGEWLDYDEAVECCGFVQGAIPGADVLIENNGYWAQGMISRLDFTDLAIPEEEKAAYKATSDLYWKAYTRGQMKAGRSELQQQAF